jgi:hypothetical protein
MEQLDFAIAEFLVIEFIDGVKFLGGPSFVIVVRKTYDDGVRRGVGSISFCPFEGGRDWCWRSLIGITWSCVADVRRGIW